MDLTNVVLVSKVRPAPPLFLRHVVFRSNVNCRLKTIGIVKGCEARDQLRLLIYGLVNVVQLNSTKIKYVYNQFANQTSMTFSILV